MSHHFVARVSAALASIIVLALAPAAALAGKEHCRKLTFDGVAGALSQDVVGFQVVRPNASVINQSDPTVQVLANESAIEFMARIVEDWCTEDGTVCPTFTTPPTSFCANSLGATSCKLKLKLAPKVFKWKQVALDTKGGLKADRRHAIRPITTRTYYGGAQMLEILVNGVSVATAPFELVMPAGA